MYKARLASLFHYPNEESVNLANPVSVDRAIDLRLGWAARRLSEEGDGFPAYSIEIEYPIVALPSSEIVDRVNRTIESVVEGEVSDFRERVLGHVAELWRESSTHLPQCTLSGSFKISLLSETLLSVRFAFSVYTGGAYSNVSYLSCNYRLNPKIEQIEFDNLFSDPRQAAEAISAHCVQELSAFYGPGWLDFGIPEGARPDPENFRCYNLHEHGISVNFHDHQLGGKALGAPSVFVPFHVFHEWLTQDCPAYRLQFWGEQ